MAELEYKNALIESKQEGDDGVLHIKFYGLAFGNVDCYLDIIEKGACARFIKSEDAKRVRMCNQHSMHDVIGVVTSMVEDEKGLLVEADILPTTLGKDVQILLKSGAINEFSIGYRPVAWRYESRPDYDESIRILEDITIYEFSPVSRAANPEAVLVSAKGDNLSTNQKNQNNMEDIQKKAEQLENEVKAAKEQAAEAQAKAEALAAEVAKKNEEINNLDASIKEQEKSIKELRLEVKTSKVVDFKTAFRNALEEKRDELTTKFKSGESFSMELKSVVNVGVSTAITGNGLSLQQDTTVAGAPYATNVFLLAFGVQPRTANKLSWIEATSQNAAGYLTELVANANKSDVQFAEKQRNFAKVGTYMTISTEVSDWFEQIYNFCVNEGAKMVADKIDALIASGVGADGTKPNEIYGLESQSTAFTALAAGKVENANIADVIIDASEQISKEGFVANAAFLPWALHAELKTLKDKQGNYLYDQATGMLQGIRIYPTSHMSAGKVLVADTNCASIVAGNSYELEFERNASIDGFNVYFRQAVQTKVKTPNKKGLVLATATTAIAALLKSV